MMDCKQASQLISQSLDRALTLRERFSLKLHLFACEFCRRFNQQMQVLRTAVKMTVSATEQNDTILLPSEAKKRIAESVEAAARTNRQ